MVGGSCGGQKRQINWLEGTLTDLRHGGVNCHHWVMFVAAEDFNSPAGKIGKCQWHNIIDNSVPHT